MLKHIFILFSVLFLVNGVQAQNVPQPEREFRAVWIATVANIDFPTKNNLSIEQQKAEIIENLKLAESLKINAVVFQVRPMCDAIYKSDIEPWSEFLTGEMGKPQNFDPLEFLVSEAHQRGILVHAWFNPYRAYHPSAKTVSKNHITKTRPDLVREYGKYLWLDPTSKEVQDYSVRVVADVVRRYDIDGVHFDDYFYPYAERDASGNKIEFPDDANWKIYQKNGGKLMRDDWRRWNVNQFIEAVGRATKRIKPEVLYGISPFGVAEENYKSLYADAEKWLREGTIDYFVPQLYWTIDRKTREFPLLLKHWTSVNAKKRHVWAGIGTYKVGNPKENFTAREIVNQISLTREIQPTNGNVHFSFKSLRNDLGGVQKSLRENVYRKDAIVPASNWIKTVPMRAPKVTVKHGKDFVRANWTEQGKRKAFWFVVYAKDASGWSYSILPAAQKSIVLSADRKIEQIVVTSVDRLGNESKR